MQPTPAAGDAFELEMDRIASVASCVAAVNAGPMPEEASSAYHHRQAWVNAVRNTQMGRETRELSTAVESWADVKRQLVQSEMAHRWRVDCVTQRYQQHMEKARSAHGFGRVSTCAA